MNTYKITTLTSALGRGTRSSQNLWQKCNLSTLGWGLDRHSIGKNTASAKALRQRGLGESEDWKVGGGAGSREEGEVVSWVGERGVARP